jgi:hypothetical protein
MFVSYLQFDIDGHIFMFYARIVRETRKDGQVERRTKKEAGSKKEVKKRQDRNKASTLQTINLVI